MCSEPEGTYDTATKSHSAWVKKLQLRCNGEAPVTQCKFCNYRDAAILEGQIATKQITQVQASTIIGCNKSTVSRHMSNCVPKKIAECMRPAPAKEETLNVVDALTTSHSKTLKILDDSLAEGDRKTALMALQTEIRQLTLNAKLTGQLNEAPQVRLLMHPEFVKLKQILIKTLEPFPDARLKLSEALTEVATDERE